MFSLVLPFESAVEASLTSRPLGCMLSHPWGLDMLPTPQLLEGRGYPQYLPYLIIPPLCETQPKAQSSSPLSQAVGHPTYSQCQCSQDWL